MSIRVNFLVAPDGVRDLHTLSTISHHICHHLVATFAIIARFGPWKTGGKSRGLRPSELVFLLVVSALVWVANSYPWVHLLRDLLATDLLGI